MATIQLKAEDLDCFPYEEQYRVRYVDGDPEEYDYCFWYLLNGKKTFELDPRNSLDGSRSFAMDDTLVKINLPQEWFDIAKKLLDEKSIKYSII